MISYSITFSIKGENRDIFKPSTIYSNSRRIKVESLINTRSSILGPPRGALCALKGITKAISLLQVIKAVR